MASLLGFGPKCCTACRRLRLYRGSEAMRDQGHNSCGSFLDVLLLGILEPCLDPQNHPMEVSRKTLTVTNGFFYTKQCLLKDPTMFCGGRWFFCPKDHSFSSSANMGAKSKDLPIIHPTRMLSLVCYLAKGSFKSEKKSRFQSIDVWLCLLTHLDECESFINKMRLGGPLCNLICTSKLSTKDSSIKAALHQSNSIIKCAEFPLLSTLDASAASFSAESFNRLPSPQKWGQPRWRLGKGIEITSLCYILRTRDASHASGTQRVRWRELVWPVWESSWSGKSQSPRFHMSSTEILLRRTQQIRHRNHLADCMTGRFVSVRKVRKPPFQFALHW